MVWRVVASVAGFVAGVVLAGAAAEGQAPASTSQRQGAAALSPGRVETLRAVAALPVDVVGEFREPLGYQRLADGRQFVFDRRGHTVYAIDAAGTASRKLVAIGGEAGRVIEPTAFDVAANGTFVVADAPNGRERLQFFSADGHRLSGFSLPGRATARVTLGSLSLSGIGTLQYTGRSLLISQPETGGLMTEYGLAGTPVRTIGRLRRTGHEPDRELHLALNAGIPLADPTGGFWFVFLAGPPAFAKFDARGTLLFHRVMQGRELDPVVAGLPEVWPRRAVDGTEIPLVAPTVRTAAVDPAGRLWVSFVVPYTYVFDGSGEKIRTVQFQAAGLLAPSSLYFPSPARLLVTPGCHEFAVR
ncbi:MAG: hypothetical protein AB7U83_00465 [Vicinamibacterales bacterium]